MKIERYVRSLLPNFGKNKVMEDLRSINEELTTNTIPCYEKAVTVLKGKKWPTDLMNDMEGQFEKRVGLYSVNHINAIYRCLKNCNANVTALIDIVDNNYASDIMREGISYLMANQLQYIEVCNFVSPYARRWLIYTYGVMTMASSDQKNYKKMSEFSKEEEYLRANKENFILSMGILSKSPKEVEKNFDKIPDIVADPDKASIASATVGASNLDPFGFNLIPVAMYPIYHVRMAFAQWQVNRHLLMQEEKKQLEYKLLALKEMKSGDNVDPRLDRQIEYTEMRIEKLRYKLNRLVEEAND